VPIRPRGGGGHDKRDESKWTVSKLGRGKQGEPEAEATVEV